MATPRTYITNGHGHDGSVDVKVVSNVAVLTLKCGENRFNHATVAKINAALDQVEGNPDAQVLITTSVGKFYSTGLDLLWMEHLAKTNQQAEVTKFLKSFHSLVARILVFPLPTIALINGHAAAGGAILALAHDIRIMRKDRGFFYLSEVRIGLPFKGMIQELVRQKIPQGAAFTEAVILGKRLTAADTQRLGISTISCDENELEETGSRVARDLLKQGPLDRRVLTEHKKNMYSSILSPVVDGKALEPYLNFSHALKLAKI